MNLQEKINDDFLQAYKSHNEICVDILRILKSEIKNTEIALKKTLEDADVVTVIKRQIKQHRDTIDIYEKSGKNEAKEKELREIEILEKYLPKQLSEDELRSIAQDKISALNATGPSDMGKVIGAIMAENKGKADGVMVSKIVKELLS